MPQLNSITFTEFVGKEGMGQSPKEVFGFPDPPDCHSRTSKVWDTAWNDRMVLTGGMLQNILGYCLMGSGQGIAGGNYISRVLPANHADWTAPAVSLGLSAKIQDYIPYLWANKVSIEGYGVDQSRPAGVNRMKDQTRQTAVYANARHTVEFLAFPFFCLTDAQMVKGGYVDTNGNPDESTFARYVTVLPKPKGRYMGLGQATSSGFFYANYATDPGNVKIANSPVQQSPGRILPEWDLQVRHWRLSQLAVASILVNPHLKGSGTLGAIDTTIGKVNATAFAGYAAGTLLYLPPELIRYIDPYGIPTYDVIHYFQFVPQTHLTVPAFSDGRLRFVEISTDTNTYNPPNPGTGTPPPAGVHIYDTADFAPLFRWPF